MVNQPKLWASGAPSDATIARAMRDYDLIICPHEWPQTADDIVALSAQYDAIMVVTIMTFSSSVATRLAPRLRIIANLSVGHDHCDVRSLRAANVAVTNTPDVLSAATAELALLLMLGAARHAVAGDSLVRRGAWTTCASRDGLVGKQVSGARVGIVGMGRIGRVFARMAQGLGMEVHYHSRRAVECVDATFHADIESLLGVADFLSLHCPATAETEGMMSAARFALLPYGAVFVNTARGALVDEDALLDALRSGAIAGAGLDCFRVEPGGNPAFAEMDNVFMMPHIGCATRETLDAIGARALDNLDAFFAGETPRDLL